MKDVRLRTIVLAGALLAAGAVSARAQSAPPAESPAPVQDPQPPPAPSPAPPPGQDPAALPASQVPPGASKVFNPDISVIGNFLGVAGENQKSEQPSMQMSEVEVAFQAVVDPYARADFFVSISPEGAEVEEGFITFTALPGGVLAKVGKMRAQFGKVNAMHTHILPWADRPLVLQNLVGGEEGIVDTGVSLSKLIPNSFMFLEATGEMYRGDSYAFKSLERSKLSYVGRVRAYRDLTEGTNLDLGGSFAAGPSAWWPDFNKQLFGFDATFRYRPLRRAIYKRFIARTELVWSRHDMPEGSPKEKAFGWFASADYQFARRWYLGARVDSSDRIRDPLHDSGGSVYLTFWPSEFSQVRTQYRRTQYGEGTTAHEVLFQLNFSIGAHGAHTF